VQAILVEGTSQIARPKSVTPIKSSNYLFYYFWSVRAPNTAWPHSTAVVATTVVTPLRRCRCSSLSTHWFRSLPHSLFVSASIYFCLSVPLSLSLSVCLSVCMSLSLSHSLSASACICVAAQSPESVNHASARRTKTRSYTNLHTTHPLAGINTHKRRQKWRSLERLQRRMLILA